MRHTPLRYHQANTTSRSPPKLQARRAALNTQPPAAFPTGRLRLLLAGVLLLLTAAMVAETLRWPWTNDAQVFHYALLLMGRGLAPYREIIDLNLPGSYLSEWIGMHLAPSTDLSYRLYDLLLLAGFGWAAVRIARPFNWFAGVLAATLFALLHASEGAWMLGERDLVMAVLLAGSYALALNATPSTFPPGVPQPTPTRTAYAARTFASALLLALACTLKPFALLYTLPLLALPFYNSSPRRTPETEAEHTQNRDAERRIAPGTGRNASQNSSPDPRRLAPLLLPYTAAFTLVAAATLAFLLWRNSLPAFLAALRLAAGYSGTNHTSLAYMLHHSTPRGLYFLLPPAVVLAVWNRSWRNPRILTLQLATALGLLSYFAQNKGFIYHRYPWIAFALLWLTLECTLPFLPRTASKTVPSTNQETVISTGAGRSPAQRRNPLLSTTPQQLLAAATLLAATLLIAPFYLLRTFHMPPDTTLPTAIAADLRTLQSTGIPLNNHIQCLDGIAGCYSALYRLNLGSSTGFMGDQLLFQTIATPAVQQARSLFQQQLAADPPTVFVETNYWYGGPQQFSKIATWPAFNTWLQAHYTPILTRTFPQQPGDIDPIGYRIYLRRTRGG